MSYPEHDKLQKVVHRSQAIGEFLEWLGEQGICLASYGRNEWDDEQLWPILATTNNLLAEYFEIDLDKIETEKRAMLDEIRQANERADS